MTYRDGSKSGGRKPGSKNKLTLAKMQIRSEAMKLINDKLPESAFKGDRVEFLQAIYKSPNFDPDMRMEAATRAAQFERAKKTENVNMDTKTFVVRMPTPVADMDEWKAKYLDVTPSEPIDPEWEEKLRKIREDAVARQITKEEGDE